MSTLAVPIIYPDSDGKPIADNTHQYDWIVRITGGLRHLFAKDPNVFIAGDLFWYPVEAHPEIRVAPDTLVVFGRPPGHRGSYRQWEEGGIPPQVVFEILSPNNRFGEMSAKFDFYRRYGVEEYYIYDPDPQGLELSGFLRHGDGLVEIPTMHGHVSPRLNVKFEMHDDGLRLIAPDGRPFRTFEEIVLETEQAERKAEEYQRLIGIYNEQAERYRREADEQRRRADEAEKVAPREPNPSRESNEP